MRRESYGFKQKRNGAGHNNHNNHSNSARITRYFTVPFKNGNILAGNQSSSFKPQYKFYKQ
jgi:hypothetical protein